MHALVLACLLLAPGAGLPYQDPNLPVEARVRDLLSRMTVEEKLAQLRCDGRPEVYEPALRTTGFGEIAPVLRGFGHREAARRANELQRMALRSRLKIPVIVHDEALHGLVSQGCTSFPQAIGLAATWNPRLVERVAGAIAAETKARGVRHVLSPVINVVRDARWGRVEETYGEDPLLNADFGVAFVRAFERSGVVTTPKHYIVNVWDGGRDSHAVDISERQLREIYLPPFEAVIRQAGARSIMASYNSVNGRPASASRWLLTDILRGELGFRGFVVSDYGSVHGVRYAHRTAASDAEAAAQCLLAGLDMEYPDVNLFGKPLEEAVSKGLVSKAALDRAVARVLRVKFELGLFEKPFVDEDQAESIVGQASHRQLALEAARESVVLLKNDGVLPFRESTRRLLVVGPAATGGIRLGGYSGWGMPQVSIVDGLRRVMGPTAEVRHVRGWIDAATQGHPTVQSSFLRPDLDGGQRGLRAEYFANPNWRGAASLVRTDATVDFDWGDGGPGTVPENGFSVRWTGYLLPEESGPVEFSLTSDDGAWLYLDGKLVIDNGGEHAPQTRTAVVRLEAGKPVALRLDYNEFAGQAMVRLGWSRADREDSLLREAVAAAGQADAIVVVGTINEGEGRDRSDLGLPGDQPRVIRSLAETGKPLVVVLLAGAPVTMRDWIGGVQAVLHAWYPGQEGGTAIAEVLFGKVNPSGKLPITFPQSVGQCPIYYNLAPSGRGYDYVDLSGRPLFPFGHGLSYTSFEYADLRVSPNPASTRGAVTVTVRVKNVGKMPGAEVVQVYLRDETASVVRPLKELKAYRKVFLQPGEAQTVRFSLPASSLSFLDERMRRVVEPGWFEVMVGSSSEDIRLRTRFEAR
ncbi:MAG: glycoside hydrolase family 3 C-terminal domain-containing protein [Fimbriimonadales bacterium]|nr:glycoside hydrolase family 3 C-terminal domain-containing protein [Fimbriimonadales bacterium]